jgi:signal transduction histidine kinase/CheY-like chemotaxis protein/AraC-like DNA-binding protein
MSFELSRKIYLINLFGYLAAIAAFPFIFIFPVDYLRLSAILFVVIAFACVWLNNKGFHTFARYGLLINACIHLFLTASSFGRAAGEQLIFLPVIFGIVLLYDFTEMKNLVISILITVIVLLVLEVTNYSLLNLDLTSKQQLAYYYGNLFITFGLSITIALLYFNMYAKQNIKNETVIRTAEELESTINYFATSLYGKNTVNEILWDIAKNCISQLGFRDCVIYLVNENNNILEQKAAYGPKNPKEFEIENAITIPVGEGIVGTVARTGVAEVIPDTSKDSRYIVDDERRFSEITVPIIYQDKVIGIIDSEHPEKNFFSDLHLKVLTTIAALASNKIVKAFGEEEMMKATIDRLEADKIKEVNRLKSQFFAHISHEFRTPMTLILGPLDEMVRKSDDPDELKQLKVMQSNGRKLLRLINDLLELSKFDEGKLNLNLTNGDIYMVLQTIINSFHSQAAQKGIVIESNVPSEPLIVSFDTQKIETILINLLSNAIKFSPEKRPINFSVSHSLNRLEITVTNEGPEIPADQLEKIFERYYQSENKQQVEGHGIGLALSKELAIMQGGNIHVSSDKNGTSFTLSIPAPMATEKPGEIVVPEFRGEMAGAGDTIDIEAPRRPVVLIVEDSDQLRAFLRRILMDDFELMEAANGKEGLKIALDSVPDLIISDIMMPEMDGRQLCYLAKTTEVTSHIPVLLLTALADLDSKLEGLELGADYYLAKPFEPRELLTVSTNLIQQRKKLREQFSKRILLKTQEWQGVNADEQFLQKLMSLVEDNLADPDFSIEDLQRELGISRMQLHRKLKALTDKSATEFIRTIRLKIAAEKLLKGVDNVSQIAYQVGFNSLSYFTKCFKEQFGMLPSAYASKKINSPQ